MRGRPYRLRAPAALLALAAAAGLPGCARRPAAAVTVRASCQPYITFGPLFIAVEEGFFAREGLSVELVRLASTRGGIAALASGRLDVASAITQAGVFNAMARGARVRLVADKGSLAAGTCPADGLVLRRGLAAAGGDARALAGLRVSFSPATIEELALDRLLAGAGLTLADVRAVDIPPTAELDAMRGGSLDATMTSEPQLSRLRAAGAGELWAPLSRVSPELQLAFLMYGEKLLDRDRETGRRFMVAYLAGVRRYGEGATERNVAILARHTGLPAEVIRSACWQTIRADGRVDTASLLEFQRWAHAKGYVDTVVPAEELVDTEFTTQACRALGPPPSR